MEVGGLALAGPGKGVAGGRAGLDDLDVEDDLGPLALGGDGESGEGGEQSELVADGVHEVTSGVS